MKFFIQRHASGLVGNCMLWWRKGGAGYTCDIDDAELFDRADPEYQDIMQNNPDKYTAWNAEYIYSVAERHVNGDKINHDVGGMKRGGKVLTKQPGIV